MRARDYTFAMTLEGGRRERRPLRDRAASRPPDRIRQVIDPQPQPERIAPVQLEREPAQIIEPVPVEPVTERIVSTPEPVQVPHEAAEVKGNRVVRGTQIVIGATIYGAIQFIRNKIRLGKDVFEIIKDPIKDFGKEFWKNFKKTFITDVFADLKKKFIPGFLLDVFGGSGGGHHKEKPKAAAPTSHGGHH